jgi:hypothetical protein
MRLNGTVTINNRGPVNIPFEPGPTADRMNFQYVSKLLFSSWTVKQHDAANYRVKRYNVRGIILINRV